MSNTIIVIDGGGRGAALVHAYSKSPHVDRIIAIPGNDLMQINTDKEVVTYQNLKTTSVKEIVEIAIKENVSLVDVAQDNAVAIGLVDRLTQEGILTVGPTKEAGQIEWDKAWARDFGVRHNLPQPVFQSFNSVEAGIEFIKSHPAKASRDKKWFIKAAGLAEGKGVLPAHSNEEAIEKVKELNTNFKQSAETYLIEEWIEGEEFSAFIVADGTEFQILGFAQDHKRVNDGDEGPNTGGMGCSTPPLVINSNIQIQISKIFEATIDGLIIEGRPYTGVLYLGGIIKLGTNEVYIIEFNSRWGDPEAEVIIPSLKGDFYDLSQQIGWRKLSNEVIQTDGRARVAIAAASKGYPGDYSRVKGKEIRGLEDVLKQKGITIYGAGVKKDGDKYFASGGRLFYIVADGKDVIEARKKAYDAMSLVSIEGDGLHYRRDIGYRDIDRIQT